MQQLNNPISLSFTSRKAVLVSGRWVNQFGYGSLALLLLLNFAACEVSSIPVDGEVEGTDHFPLEVGRSWWYEVDSITVRPVIGGIVYDTARLEVRESLVDTFRSQDDRRWYRGERWQRPRSGGSWRFDQSFALSADGSAALRTEDNLTFTKLSFPLRAGKSWDGHTAFDEFRSLPIGGEFLDIYAGWNYGFAEVGMPHALPTGLSFAESALVEQAETDNLIDLRRAYERYVPDVGLVERFIDARHTQCQQCCGGDTGQCLDLPWSEKAEKGFILRQYLTKFE